MGDIEKEKQVEATRRADMFLKQQATAYSIDIKSQEYQRIRNDLMKQLGKGVNYKQAIKKARNEMFNYLIKTDPRAAIEIEIKFYKGKGIKIDNTVRNEALTLARKKGYGSASAFLKEEVGKAKRPAQESSSQSYSQSYINDEKNQVSENENPDDFLSEMNQNQVSMPPTSQEEELENEKKNQVSENENPDDFLSEMNQVSMPPTSQEEELENEKKNQVSMPPTSREEELFKENAVEYGKKISDTLGIYTSEIELNEKLTVGAAIEKAKGITNSKKRQEYTKKIVDAVMKLWRIKGNKKNKYGIEYREETSDPLDVYNTKSFNCFSGSIAAAGIAASIMQECGVNGGVDIVEVSAINKDEEPHAVMQVSLGGNKYIYDTTNLNIDGPLKRTGPTTAKRGGITYYLGETITYERAFAAAQAQHKMFSGENISAKAFLNLPHAFQVYYLQGITKEQIEEYTKAMENVDLKKSIKDPETRATIAVLMCAHYENLDNNKAYEYAEIASKAITESRLQGTINGIKVTSYYKEYYSAFNLLDKNNNYQGMLEIYNLVRAGALIRGIKNDTDYELVAEMYVKFGKIDVRGKIAVRAKHLWYISDAVLGEMLLYNDASMELRTYKDQELYSDIEKRRNNSLDKAGLDSGEYNRYFKKLDKIDTDTLIYIGYDLNNAKIISKRYNNIISIITPGKEISVDRQTARNIKYDINLYGGEWGLKRDKNDENKVIIYVREETLDTVKGNLKEDVCYNAKRTFLEAYGEYVSTGGNKPQLLSELEKKEE